MKVNKSQDEKRRLMRTIFGHMSFLPEK
jgi:hypothetical protein